MGQKCSECVWLKLQQSGIPDAGNTLYRTSILRYILRQYHTAMETGPSWERYLWIARILHSDAATPPCRHVIARSTSGMADVGTSKWLKQVSKLDMTSSLVDGCVCIFVFNVYIYMNTLIWQQKDIDDYLGCTGFILSNIDLCVHKYVYTCMSIYIYTCIYRYACTCKKVLI